MSSYENDKKLIFKSIEEVESEQKQLENRVRACELKSDRVTALDKVLSELSKRQRQIELSAVELKTKVAMMGGTGGIVGAGLIELIKRAV